MKPLWLLHPRCLMCLACVAQLDLKTYIGTIEYTETEEEEKNVKVLDLVKAGEIAFSASPYLHCICSTPHVLVAAPFQALRSAYQYDDCTRL